MKGFEQYDLRAWLDSGLSRHPDPLRPVSSHMPRAGRFLTKIAVPLMALGASGMIQAAPMAQLLAGPSSLQAMHVVRSDQFLAAMPATSLIHRTVSGAAPIERSIVDEFHTQAATLLADVRAGKLTNVPSETLRIAVEAVGRYAETDSSGRPDWVDEVANDVAKLTD
jgi:hypothetical protein